MPCCIDYIDFSYGSPRSRQRRLTREDDEFVNFTTNTQVWGISKNLQGQALQAGRVIPDSEIEYFSVRYYGEMWVSRRPRWRCWWAGEVATQSSEVFPKADLMIIIGADFK